MGNGQNPNEQFESGISQYILHTWDGLNSIETVVDRFLKRLKSGK